MNWPPIDADGPVVAAAREILRNTTKTGRYWSLNEWRHFVFDKIAEYGLKDQPTSEARMAVLGPILNQYGAAPQRGSAGRWTGRIYFPAPPPKDMASPSRDERDDEHGSDVPEHIYWWDFQRFADIVQDPWGSTSWVWIVRQDPGPPPRPDVEPPPPPPPPPPPDDGMAALRKEMAQLRKEFDELKSTPVLITDERIIAALSKVTARVVGRTSRGGANILSSGHEHDVDLRVTFTKPQE